jgi:magnesium transporter
MNFDNMPELQSHFGYYTVWAIMILVALGMLGLFWRRGWIGSGKPKRRKHEGQAQEP